VPGSTPRRISSSRMLKPRGMTGVDSSANVMSMSMPWYCTHGSVNANGLRLGFLNTTRYLVGSGGSACDLINEFKTLPLMAPPTHTPNTPTCTHACHGASPRWSKWAPWRLGCHTPASGPQASSAGLAGCRKSPPE
jgi:hypothetical protein